jgi:hypothetical protein
MSEYLMSSILIWTSIFTLVLFGGMVLQFPKHFDFSSPQILVPVIFFITISLVLWVGVLTERWYASGLMRWEWIPQVLQFASLYIGLFWVGFWSKYGFNNQKTASRSVNVQIDNSPMISFSPTFLFLLFVGFSLLQVVPRWDSIWLSDTPRGYGQWQEWDTTQYISLLGTIGQVLCVVLSGIVWVNTRALTLLMIPLLELVILGAGLSRGILVPILLFLLAAHVSGLRIKKFFLLGGIFALLLGSVVIIVRGQSDTPGLYRLVSETSNINVEQFPAAIITSVNSMEVQTAAFSMRDESLGAFDGFGEWMRTLMPIPTFIGWFDKREVSLADAMGISGGNVGIPFTHLGELFYKMGWWGVGVGFIVGVWFGFLQKKVHVILWAGGRPSWQHSFLYVVSFYGVLLSFHTATRAATRPLLYALIFIFLYRIYKEINGKFTLAVSSAPRATHDRDVA